MLIIVIKIDLAIHKMYICALNDLRIINID